MRFIREDGGDGYTYEFLTSEELRHIAGMPTRSAGSIRILREDVAAIRDALDDIAGMANPDQALANLHGIADHIYHQLPQALREAYCAIRAKLGDDFAIQLVTDDPGIPWELARPSYRGARNDILCTTHPIARWHPNQHPPARPDLCGSGKVLTIAPRYDGDEALPRAQQEARFMARLGAKRLKAPVSRTKFMNALCGERLSVLHVAAHGSFVKHRPPLSKLHLEAEEFVTAAEIRGESKSALERGFVILNVCEGGAAAGHLGGAVVGLAESFLEHGAAAVLAPLWSVPDDEALAMTERCLPRILKGDALSRVVRDARHGDAPSIHPLAYLLWGEVTAAFR